MLSRRKREAEPSHKLLNFEHPVGHESLAGDPAGWVIGGASLGGNHDGHIMLPKSLQFHQRYSHSVSDHPVRLETTSELETDRPRAALFDENNRILDALLRAASSTPFLLVAAFEDLPTAAVGLSNSHVVSMATRILGTARATASTTKLSTIATRRHLPHLKVMVKHHHKTR